MDLRVFETLKFKSTRRKTGTTLRAMRYCRCVFDGCPVHQLVAFQSGHESDESGGKELAMQSPELSSEKANRNQGASYTERPIKCQIAKPVAERPV